MKISELQTTVVNPLSLDELKICKQTARNLPARREADFIFDIVPYTGLLASEFVHLKAKWITWPDEMHNINCPVIEVPERDECGYTRWDETPPSSISKDGPCYECQRWGNTDDWESYKPRCARKIPVREPIAQDALKRYFKIFGFDVNPWGPDHRKEVIQRVNETSTLSRDVHYKDLVHTFIHICAEVQEFDKNTIVSIAPYSEVRGGLRRILLDSTVDYNLHFDPADYLRVISRIEPVTCNELAEESGKSYNVSRRAINNLVKERIVEEVGKRYRQYGTDVAEYRISADIEVIEGIQCTECDETFSSFKGRSKHERIVHGNESYPGS